VVLTLFGVKMQTSRSAFISSLSVLFHRRCGGGCGCRYARESCQSGLPALSDVGHVDGIAKFDFLTAASTSFTNSLSSSPSSSRSS